MKHPKHEYFYYRISQRWLSEDPPPEIQKFPQYSVDDFFEIISNRYEKGSMIITTNQPFEQWGNIFGDTILAEAILDRVVHHSMIFTLKYLRQSRRVGYEPPKAGLAK